MKRNNKISALSVLPAGYAEFLNSLRVRIRSAQMRAALSASRELIQLYCDIGEGIVERQKKEGWGKSVVEKLSNVLRKEFPDIGGFSTQNIWRMRAFYLAWSAGKHRLPATGSLIARVARELSSKNRVRSGAGDQGTVLSQSARELKFPEVLARLPWFHNVMLGESIKDTAERFWYEPGHSGSVRRHARDPGCGTSPEFLNERGSFYPSSVFLSSRITSKAMCRG